MTRRWALAAAGVAAFFSISISACGVRPGISNGSVSACFRALPTARAAIHDRSARMIGLHRLRVDQVEASLYHGTGTSVPEQDTVVCAAVFQGSFAPGQVTAAPSADHGRYAVVLVTSSDLKLLAAFVVDRLPTNLGRRLF